MGEENFRLTACVNTECLWTVPTYQTIMWVKKRQRLHTLITLDNGSMQATIFKPGGHIVCIQYGGLDNLLEASNKEKNRGYWDLEWNIP